ncbi:MAG TPA: hypothetical protein VGP33_17110 [Chloroflexota bacterium]|jgi:hypothetical protein|nr:hypothetical protein [Chloroflexota bacterium]
MIEKRPEAATDPACGAELDASDITCPACRAAQQAVDALLQHVATADPATIPWRNVCNTHAWQCSGQTTVSLRIAAARLEVALAQLDGGSGAAGHARQRSSIAGDACQFCTAMAAAAETAVQGAPSAAEVFCLPHLCAALLQARNRERLQALVTIALARGDALEQELSELIRKSDYRYRDEPRGPEATSWRRAAQRLAGAAGVRWSLRRDPEIEG